MPLSQNSAASFTERSMYTCVQLARVYRYFSSSSCRVRTMSCAGIHCSGGSRPGIHSDLEMFLVATTGNKVSFDDLLFQDSPELSDQMSEALCLQLISVGSTSRLQSWWLGSLWIFSVWKKPFKGSTEFQGLHVCWPPFFGWMFLWHQWLLTLQHSGLIQFVFVGAGSGGPGSSGILHDGTDCSSVDPLLDVCVSFLGCAHQFL